MKKLKNISLMAFVGFLFMLGTTFSSCVDEMSLKNLPYIFRPINFTATMNSTLVTFNWAKVDSAVSYTLQVGTDSANFVKPVFSVTTTNLFYVKELAGNTTFYARIRANDADSTKSSQFNNTLTFKTPKENIFLGYGTKNNTGNTYSAYMNAANTLDIKWKPAANVTHLILTSADGGTRDSVAISTTEATAGEKIVPALTNSNWTVSVYNGTILRGTVNGLVEGDIVLTAGGDLVSTLNNASAGQVIILSGTTPYTLGGAEYKFSKNIKIRSTSVSSRSIICLTTGATAVPSSTSNLMSVVASSAIDSLVFENIDFTGYCDNNPASTKIGYLFSNKTACTVNNIKFTNCNIHNLGNTPFRLSGGTAATPTTSQRISNLIFNGCIINETGFSSGYGIVNISKSFDYIDNITIANSTLYNFSYPVISIVQSAVTGMNSVTIQNCNFNQTTQNIGATRVLFNFDYMNISNGISIKNCIFGSSGSMSAGLKATNSNTPIATTITGCYFTSDYIDETLVGGIIYSMKSSMTAYPSASTSLWTDPINGNFSLKDTNFTGKGSAGDLRW